MPTRVGWGLAVVGALTLIAARIFGLAELFVLGVTAVGLLGAAVLLVTRPAASIAVERLVTPPRVQLGGQCRIELRVTNPGSRPSPVVDLHEPIAGTVGAQVSIPPLAPGEVEAATYRLPTVRRGLMPIGPLSMTRTDPFGLVSRTVELVEQVTVTVLPAIEMIGPVGTGGGIDDPLAGLTHTVMGVSGEEDFSSLRDYVVGDDLRRVHWASSARNGDLLVREDDPPWRGHVTVVLDTRSERMEATIFEAAVSAAASVLHGVSVHGDRARLMTTCGIDTGLVDAAAERDLLLEHLALVTQHDDGRFGDLRPPGRGNPGGLVVVTGDGGSALSRDQNQGVLTGAARHYSVTRLVSFSSAPAAATGSGRTVSSGSITSSDPSIRVLHVPSDVSFVDAWRASFLADSTARGSR